PRSGSRSSDRWPNPKEEVRRLSVENMNLAPLPGEGCGRTWQNKRLVVFVKFDALWADARIPERMRAVLDDSLACDSRTIRIDGWLCHGLCHRWLLRRTSGERNERSCYKKAIH